MFLVGAAEGAALLAAGDRANGRSKANVFKFFDDFVPPSIQTELAAAFTRLNGTPLGLRDAVLLLYRVRCSLAHPGPYWKFKYATPQRTKTVRFGDDELTSTLSYDTLRNAILAGSVQAALRCLPAVAA
jgi:hypothetical protein